MASNLSEYVAAWSRRLRRRDLRFCGAWLALALLGACGNQRLELDVQLPSTPVLTLRTQRAVVTTDALRIRESPDQAGGIISYLREGAVVEILSQTDAEVEVEGERSFWYQISYEGIRGWVFGAYLAPEQELTSVPPLIP